MKKRSEKGSANNANVKSEVDHPTQDITMKCELVINQDESWLQALTTDNQLSRQRHLRNLHAEHFLHKILYPLVTESSELNEKVLVKLIVEYWEANIDQEAKFEMSNVFGGLLQHLSFFPADSDASILSESSMLNKDISLFMILSDLDLDAVDREVSILMNDE